MMLDAHQIAMTGAYPRGHVLGVGHGGGEAHKGQVRRRKRAVQTRGLNANGNRRLKRILKAAVTVAKSREPVKGYFERLLARGLSEDVARVQVARKLAATLLSIWKKGEQFSQERFLTQTS